MILDKLGKEITPGCFIAYGHALGRCAGIRIGKVLKVTTKKHEWHDEIVYRINVQGIEDDWSFEKAKLAKRGTLQFPDRIIVLAPDQVPEAYRSILEQA